MKPFCLGRYGPISGKTGVQAFAILPGALLVQFRSGEGYLYDEEQPGARQVKIMTQLALRGRGLSTFISQHVQDRYRLKLSRKDLEHMLQDITSSLAEEV